MKKITAALIQQSCSAGRKETINKTAALIKDAAKQGANLICLQELHTSLYFCQIEDPSFFDLAETIPGPSTDFFAKLAKDFNVVIVTSLFEKRATGLYHNTAVVLDSDGSIAGKYRKMHIPDDPGYYEKFYFIPGDLGFQPIETSIGTLGVLICWDQWYPEAARLMAMNGAEILIYPTAIGWDPLDKQNEQTRQRDAWITIQRSHAIANGIPVIAVNRTGFEKSPDPAAAGSQFWGSSFVAGCQGEIIAQASIDKDDVLVTDLDLTKTESVRRMWPYFRDRRIDAYSDITKRFCN